MKNSKKMKVLILEDEELLLEAITKKLQLNGFEAVACTGGQQALDYLNSTDQLPDAIWLDYYLKDMDGLVFMNELKKNNHWTDIPVFVVSNSANDEKIHTMLALGVKKYLLKAEYRLEDIMEIISHTLTSNSLD